jgi:hypothetical protein
MLRTNACLGRMPSTFEFCLPTGAKTVPAGSDCDGNTVEILLCDFEPWESPNPNGSFVVGCKANGFRLI